MDIKVEQTSLVNSLLSKQQSKDKEFNDLFIQITSLTDSINIESSIKRNYELVLSLEFLLIKLRILLTSEIAIVKQGISSSLIASSVKLILKQREGYLISQFQRLNEIRDDISVIQKLVYTKSFQNSI